MTIYFLNYFGCDPQSAASLKQFLTQYNAHEITVTLPGDSNGSSLLFVHGMPEKKKEKIARDNEWLHVIGVSSFPESICPPDMKLSNLHRCRHSTSTLAGSSLACFLEQYIASGYLDWKLIEPLKSKVSLIALYLLDLSKTDTEEIRNMKEKVLAEANMEYLELQGSGDNLPKDCEARKVVLRGFLESG